MTEPFLPTRPRVAVVVGNPKPASRTLAAATHLATELSGAAPDLVVDLGTLGARLLDWSDAGRRPSWWPRWGPPTWWSSRARPTRPPTPGCSRSSWTASPAAPACAASPCR